MKETIAILGFGNMGSAIAQQLENKFTISVFDKDLDKTKDLSAIVVANRIADLVINADTIILAIKPQDLYAVLDEIRLELKNKLLISVAAGITTDYLKKRLGKVRIIRAMPNLPAKIGLGMICLAKGEFSSQQDLEFSEGLFRNLGKTLLIEESLMDAATAVSGSGPGYLYYLLEGKDIAEAKIYTRDVFIPALFESAKKIGFTERQANILSQTTGVGSLLFLEKTGVSPKELKAQVASKGGTTQAGLDVLQTGGSLEDAVKAALLRAGELSKKE